MCFVLLCNTLQRRFETALYFVRLRFYGVLLVKPKKTIICLYECKQVKKMTCYDSLLFHVVWFNNYDFCIKLPNANISRKVSLRNTVLKDNLAPISLSILNKRGQSWKFCNHILGNVCLQERGVKGAQTDIWCMKKCVTRVMTKWYLVKSVAASRPCNSYGFLKKGWKKNR